MSTTTAPIMLPPQVVAIPLETPTCLPKTAEPQSGPTAVEDPYPDFPAELKALQNWVVWRGEVRGEKTTKVPRNAATGAMASTTDSRTWCDYQNAVRASREYDGIGCVITEPYVGIDLDKCRDPESGVAESWAQEIITELDSYTELSPSGRGFHIWVKGSLQKGGRSRAGKVEMYDHARYFTVTGVHVHRTPTTIEARDVTAFQARLTDLDPRYRSKTAPKPKELAASETAPKEVAAASPTPCQSKFDLLMAGHWEGRYRSQSEADFGAVRAARTEA